MGMTCTGGCGDEYPSTMVFEGRVDKYYCSWCLGLDPFLDEDEISKMQWDETAFDPNKITEMFWSEFRKD